MNVRPITLEVYDIRALQAARKSVLHLPYELSPTDAYQPGDLLWVREAAFISKEHFTSQEHATHADGRIIGYQSNMDADAVSIAQDYGVKRTPAMKMPRFASRFTLALQAVCVISLDNITEHEAKQSGIWFDGAHYRGGRHPVRGTLNRHSTALAAFRDAWSSMHMNTDYSMHRNPRILRLAFTSIAQNVDEYLAEIECMSTPTPSLRPRLEAIAKQHDQKALIQAVCDRAAHLSDVAPQWADSTMEGP